MSDLSIAAPVYSQTAARRTWSGNRQLLSWLVPAVLVLAWEALARFGKIPPYILPAPTQGYFDRRYRWCGTGL